MRKTEHVQESGLSTGDPAAPTGVFSVHSDSAPVTQPDHTAEIQIADASTAQADTGNSDEAAPKLSKNQLKKQRRWERWEAGRDDRKLKRKQKIKEKKERRRAEWEEHRAEGGTSQPPPTRPSRQPHGVQVPITVLFDCDFEDYMHDHELKSLGLQITRSYSDNRKAPFRFHLGISSWGGKMKERFDGVLAGQYTSWKGFHTCTEDFVEASQMSKEWMTGPQGGTIAGALQNNVPSGGEEEGGEIVYLSAESDTTLERLKPNSTYIIGGLVDKNRHKGLCYKRALDRGIKTAKLPIGEFLQMDSRKVLVTNHVLDIMLKWLEHDDWGKAFIEVLPKRKGGMLKTGDDAEEHSEDEEANDMDEKEIHAESNAAECPGEGFRAEFLGEVDGPAVTAQSEAK